MLDYLFKLSDEELLRCCHEASENAIRVYKTSIYDSALDLLLAIVEELRRRDNATNY